MTYGPDKARLTFSLTFVASIIALLFFHSLGMAG